MRAATVLLEGAIKVEIDDLNKRVEALIGCVPEPFTPGPRGGDGGDCAREGVEPPRGATGLQTRLRCADWEFQGRGIGRVPMFYRAAAGWTTIVPTIPRPQCGVQK